ncbi:MAG: rhomboid family intramembrane serine protease [Sphingomonadaceae bacterium]|nr:rhomboid family intramembrane serine protease [Sphingomonadaceae bacterium]
MVLGGPARLTKILAVATAATWAIAALFALTPMLSIEGGFIPARVAGGAGFSIPVWLTPLTATLVHGGLLHIAFNLVMLIYCGREVEAVLGWKPLALLYFVGAYAAAAGQYVVDPGSQIPMIGASGAISAVLAVYALLFSRNEVKRFGPIPSHWVRALWLAAAWIAVQWLIALATRGGGFAVATPAHVGGFLAGLALARPLLSWRLASGRDSGGPIRRTREP